MENLPISDTLFKALVVSWPLWAVTFGGFIFFRVCRAVYRFRRRFKRCF